MVFGSHAVGKRKSTPVLVLLLEPIREGKVVSDLTLLPDALPAIFYFEVAATWLTSALFSLVCFATTAA